MRITSAVPVLMVLTVMGVGTGCSDVPPGRAGPSAAPASAPPSTPPSTPPTRTPIPAKVGARLVPTTIVASDGGRGSGNGLGVIDVRTGQHRGYDRVVFDLGGTGTPGWYADYTTNPRSEGSGDPVKLEGATFLMISLRGVGLPYDTGLEPFGDDTTRVPGTRTEGIAEIAPGGVFEGEQQAFVALTGPRRPFRVFALADPARLVVDVAHP